MLALQQLLQAEIADSDSVLYGIKQVVFGDPRKIPQSNLPAITISPQGSSYNMRGSRYDQKTHSIDVKIVYNAKDFFGSDDAENTTDKVFIVEDAINKMEATLTGSHATDQHSVAGVIQSNSNLPLTENGTTVNTAELAKVVGINYPGLSESRGFHTYEAVLTMEVITIGDR